jgi:hypothetical protein
MPTDTATAPSRQTLQQFILDDLAVYTAEQAFGPTASADFRVFYVGRDDVHGVLTHLFTRVSLSVKMNMFGYDDDELSYEHAVAAGRPQRGRAVLGAAVRDMSSSVGRAAERRHRRAPAPGGPVQACRRPSQLPGSGCPGR